MWVEKCINDHHRNRNSKDRDHLIGQLTTQITFTNIWKYSGKYIRKYIIHHTSTNHSLHHCTFYILHFLVSLLVSGHFCSFFVFILCNGHIHCELSASRSVSNLLSICCAHDVSRRHAHDVTHRHAHDATHL